MLKTMITALFLFAVIEGINMFTLSWVYVQVNLGVLLIGWLILVLTFYVLP